MLRFGSVTIDAGHEPPRPVIPPRRRKTALKSGTTTGNIEYVEDWGLDTNRLIRFVSSESQGFVTAAQVTSLVSLYEAGGTFALETDLLSPLGAAAVTYAARFDPDSVPIFTSATPAGDLYYFDLAVIL